MLILTLALVQGAFAFPWVANVQGVDSSILKRSALLERDTPDCPFNRNHQPAAPVTSKYPYNNAKDGKPGNGKGGYLVPAPGDTAHEFRKPNPKTDIRGPCPGIQCSINAVVTCADVSRSQCCRQSWLPCQRWNNDV